MKRMTSRIFTLIMALLLMCQLTPAAFASGGINFGVNVAPGETETLITVGGSNDAAFAELAKEGKTFKFSVPCTYAQAYAVYGGALVDSALAEGEAEITVAKSGQYKLVNGSAPVVTGSESQISVAVSQQNDAYLDTIAVDCSYSSVKVTLNGTAVSATASGGKVVIPVNGAGTYVITQAATSGSEGGSSGTSGTASATGSNTASSGSGSAGSTTKTTASTQTPVTVPVSGNQKTVRVQVEVKGTTATVRSTQLQGVSDETVTFDFSGLDRNVDTAVIPAGTIRQAETVNVKLTGNVSMEFPSASLSEKTARNREVTISIQPSHKVKTLTKEQKKVLGVNRAYDITVMSGKTQVSDLGGEIVIRVPYTLKQGEKAEGLVVYYVDHQGNREACETFYDPGKKQVSWKTDHLSLYMISYEEPAAAAPEVTEATEAAVPVEDTPETEAAGNPAPVITESAPVQKNHNWLLYICAGCLLTAVILGGYLIILMRKKDD